MPQISVQGIRKIFKPGLFKKKVKAVNGLDLDIREGEVFGLIGPNGAGKSTTIRLILGLIRPDEGIVLFNGRPVSDMVLQREIGYLPENPYLYDHLSLDELLNFCGRVSGLSPKTTELRKDELVRKLALEKDRSRALRTFSKGMLQRAGICFALLHDPDIVILDEPMSGLDPLGRKMIFNLISELRERGKTIFFCTHILNDVERLSDRIGLLVGGRLVKEFIREDWASNPNASVHFLVESLTPQQAEALRTTGAEIHDDYQGRTVSIQPEKLTDITECFARSGVKVLSSRSEQISLEELFMRTVEEVES